MSETSLPDLPLQTLEVGTGPAVRTIAVRVRSGGSPGVFWLDVRLAALATERVHLHGPHLGELAQFADQKLDVHPGAAVDLGWVFLRQDADMHVINPNGVPARSY